MTTDEMKGFGFAPLVIRLQALSGPVELENIKNADLVFSADQITGKLSLLYGWGSLLSMIKNRAADYRLKLVVIATDGTDRWGEHRMLARIVTELKGSCCLEE